MKPFYKKYILTLAGVTKETLANFITAFYISIYVMASFQFRQWMANQICLGCSKIPGEVDPHPTAKWCHNAVELILPIQLFQPSIPSNLRDGSCVSNLFVNRDIIV